ncbi:MAG TPA: hypothetical protein PKI32_04455, partial [Opitutales bacterium]|nr:hypothetical protein [Opitutales bacterium]
DLLGYQTISGNSVPITSARDYSGQAIVATGNTLAIGGLDALRNTNGTTRVPILGSIPIIGYAFRSDSKEDSKSNLIMFITATVLDGYSGGIKASSGADEMLQQLDEELESRGKEKTPADAPAKKKGQRQYLFGN